MAGQESWTPVPVSVGGSQQWGRTARQTPALHAGGPAGAHRPGAGPRGLRAPGRPPPLPGRELAAVRGGAGPQGQGPQVEGVGPPVGGAKGPLGRVLQGGGRVRGCSVLSVLRVVVYDCREHWRLVQLNPTGHLEGLRNFSVRNGAPLEAEDSGAC